MCTAASLRRAKKWKQPTCTSADERIKKIWCIHALEKYSLNKEENPMVCNHMGKPGRHYANETSQPQKDTSRMTSFCMRYFKYSTHRRRVYGGGCQEYGAGRMGIFHAVEIVQRDNWRPQSFSPSSLCCMFSSNGITLIFFHLPVSFASQKRLPNGFAGVLLNTRSKGLIEVRTAAPQYPADSLSLCLC